MIIESGVIVALGLLFTFFKLSWKMRLKMLGRPLMMDIAVFVILNILHWGTFSGVMVAATGALITSAMISLGRWAVGYIEQNKYFSGVLNVASKL
jgi:hypothetical protein